MKRLVLGRRKMSSVLCHSTSDGSDATMRGSTPASAAAAAFAPACAPGRSHTSPKSVAMKGLGAGRRSAGWVASVAQRARAAGSMGAQRWAVPYHGSRCVATPAQLREACVTQHAW